MTTRDMPRPATPIRTVAQEAAYLTVVMAERLKERWALHAGNLGVSLTGIKVLLALEADAPLVMRALADRLHFDPSNLTSVIDRLEVTGLVERRPDAVDRRVKTIAITDRGQELREAFQSRLAADPNALEQIDEADLERYNGVLRRALGLHEA